MDASSGHRFPPIRASLLQASFRRGLTALMSASSEAFRVESPVPLTLPRHLPSETVIELSLGASPASSPRDHRNVGNDKRGREHQQAQQHRPFEREALMGAEIDPGEAYKKVGRGNERAEKVDGLPDERGARHLGARDTVVARRLANYRQDSEVEGVIRDEE